MESLAQLTVRELLELLSDLVSEMDRQRETDSLWVSEGVEERLRNEERLKLELRILHAILEQDERLEDFRSARTLMFLD